jgi:hypothetical protein
MKAKYFLLIGIIFFTALLNGDAQAQRVIRKGVKPVVTKVTTVAPGFELEQLTGKWQEWKRISIADKKSIAFTDTLMLNFNKRDAVEIRDGVSMALVGEAAIEKPNRLLLAGDSYTIISISNNQLVINDGEYIRHLKKKKAFYYESLGNIQVHSEDFTVAVKPNLSFVDGKWDIYRRQAAPGFINEQTDLLIKSISIQSPDANGMAKGEISLYTKAGTEKLPCTIQFGETTMHVDAGNAHLDYNIYKTVADEFIFGRKGGLMYYAKKL